jgi:hypothetical protein
MSATFANYAPALKEMVRDKIEDCTYGASPLLALMTRKTIRHTRLHDDGHCSVFSVLPADDTDGVNRRGGREHVLAVRPLVDGGARCAQRRGQPSRQPTIRHARAGQVSDCRSTGAVVGERRACAAGRGAAGNRGGDDGARRRRAEAVGDADFVHLESSASSRLHLKIPRGRCGGARDGGDEGRPDGLALTDADVVSRVDGCEVRGGAGLDWDALCEREGGKQREEKSETHGQPPVVQ